MARTPLFRTLRRALHQARLAELVNAGTLETVAEPRDGFDEARFARRASLGRRPWSRRHFLKTSALGVSAAVLACRPPLLPRPESRDLGEVAVVGGGIAGLTCAYRLMQAGVPVRVYEGQRRVGGRMWSLRDHFPEGQVCELGGELINTDPLALRGLCAELGLELDDFEEDDPALAEAIWYFDGRRVSEAEIVEQFRPIALQIEAAWEELEGETISYRETGGAESIDRMSIAEWLDQAGASGWFRDLLDVAYTTEYGLEIDQQSAWNLLITIDPDPEPFHVLGDSDERFHIRGGNDQVPALLAEALGDRVVLDSRLEALMEAPAGGYRLSLRTGEASSEVLAERVVLALPFTMLREVDLEVPLPDVKRRAIAELGYGTNAKLMVGFSERLWRTVGGSNGSVLSDLPFQVSWESTRLQPGRGGIVVCYTGGRRGLEIGQGTAAEQAELFARAFDQVFPGGADLRTTQARFHWPSFPWVRGSYSCYLPGQWTSIAGAEGERVGNLHFAGEHTSEDFQGFMEGACESGERAAVEILVDLGLALPGEAA
jgi:monoamine oxidase